MCGWGPVQVVVSGSVDSGQVRQVHRGSRTAALVGGVVQGAIILTRSTATVTAGAAEIARLRAEPLSQNLDIDRVPARRLNILVDIDVASVVADAENANHSQYSIFHI